MKRYNLDIPILQLYSQSVRLFNVLSIRANLQVGGDSRPSDGLSALKQEKVDQADTLLIAAAIVVSFYGGRPWSRGSVARRPSHAPASLQSSSG